jgi:DNA-binding NtrC family response regulator
MAIEHLIVLDADPEARRFAEPILRQLKCAPVFLGTISQVLDALAKERADLIFSTIELPDGNASHLLLQLRAMAEPPPVALLSSSPSSPGISDAVQAGACAVLNHPIVPAQITPFLQHLETSSRLEEVVRYQNHSRDVEFLGQSPGMELVREIIRKTSRTQATVLVQGENGSGKSVAARLLHQQSHRARQPLLSASLTRIPAHLIDQELFGPNDGARRPGLLEMANGGTALLEEVAELPLFSQARLFKLLQERKLERPNRSSVSMDVRIIATTARPLEEAVQRNQFRQDLYFRLNVVPISLPALRDRREDIPLLAEHFLRRSARKHAAPIQGISSSCMAALMEHHWAGNVRELEAIIDRAVLSCRLGRFLEVDHLGLTGLGQESTFSVPARKVRSFPAPVAGTFLTLHELERMHILAAVEHCRGNRTRAARLLGISIRTLRNKLNEYSGKKASSAPQVPLPE